MDKWHGPPWFGGRRLGNVLLCALPTPFKCWRIKDIHTHTSLDFPPHISHLSALNSKFADFWHYHLVCSRFKTTSHNIKLYVLCKTQQSLCSYGHRHKFKYWKPRDLEWVKSWPLATGQGRSRGKGSRALCTILWLTTQGSEGFGLGSVWHSFRSLASQNQHQRCKKLEILCKPLSANTRCMCKCTLDCLSECDAYLYGLYPYFSFETFQEW